MRKLLIPSLALAAAAALALAATAAGARTSGAAQAAIDETVCDLRVLLEWVERDEAAGVGEAPYPPNFPKMPGEPPRVQPSRAKKK